MKTLVIVPAYNEEENIQNVISNLIDNYPEYDYLVVNDCSTDKTEAICRENGFNYITLPCNLGIGGGVQAGYLYAVANDYDITVQIDGDGQHDPSYIKEMVNLISSEGFDMVIGSRFIQKKGFQTSFMRRLGINIIALTIKGTCGFNIKDTTSGFRVCSKKMTQFFSKNYAQDYPEPEAIVTAVLNGYKVKEYPVVMHERTGGVSSINIKRSVYYMIKVSLALIIYRMSVHKIGRREGYEH